LMLCFSLFFFSSRRRHTRFSRDWSSDVCSSDLKVMLQHRESGSTQLRTALTMLGAGASPWLRDHLDEMVNRIDHGFVGADTFDTGLLERELYWYLQDMIDARGLAGGVGLLGVCLDGRVHAQVRTVE